MSCKVVNLSWIENIHGTSNRGSKSVMVVKLSYTDLQKLIKIKLLFPYQGSQEGSITVNGGQLQSGSAIINIQRIKSCVDK